MLKFTSASGSVRAITDIILTGTITRTGITLDLIIDLITGRTTGTADIVITAIIIVTPITTDASLIEIATSGWFELSNQPDSFAAESRRGNQTARDQAV